MGWNWKTNLRIRWLMAKALLKPRDDKEWAESYREMMLERGVNAEHVENTIARTQFRNTVLPYLHMGLDKYAEKYGRSEYFMLYLQRRLDIYVENHFDDWYKQVMKDGEKDL